MKLFESIDGLLVGTRYLAWGIGVLGTIGSVILFLANIPLGIGTAAVFLASFFLAIAVSLLLMPQKLAKGKLEGNKKYVIGAVSLIIAVAVMGIVYMTNGGFPAVNLIFCIIGGIAFERGFEKKSRSQRLFLSRISVEL